MFRKLNFEVPLCSNYVFPKQNYSMLIHNRLKMVVDLMNNVFVAAKKG